MTAVKIENQNPQIICHKKKIYIWRLQKLLEATQIENIIKPSRKKMKLTKIVW